jgi:hypothetical protein
MPRYQTVGGKRVEPGDAEYNWDNASTSFDPLADAKAFLADPSRSQAPQPTAEEMAAATQRAPREPMSLRGLTDIGETASLPLALMGMIPSPASPVLLGASGVLAGAGGLRKLIAPEADESRIEGGVQSALSMLPLAGKLRGLGQVASKRFPISAEKAYRGAQSLERFGGLNQAPQSIAALEAAVAAGKPQVSAEQLSKFPEAWRQFASATTPKVAKSPVKITRTPKGMISKMNRESEAGYRNTQSHGADLDMLPESGMATITPDEWKRLGMRQVSEHFPSTLRPVSPVPGTEAGYGEDLLAQLSARTNRLKIPARSRAFATNTPIPE